MCSKSQMLVWEAFEGFGSVAVLSDTSAVQVQLSGSTGAAVQLLGAAGIAMLASDELFGMHSVDSCSYDGAVASCVSTQHQKNIQ